jgi:hypothetical protein
MAHARQSRGDAMTPEELALVATHRESHSARLRGWAKGYRRGYPHGSDCYTLGILFEAVANLLEDDRWEQKLLGVGVPKYVAVQGTVSHTCKTFAEAQAAALQGFEVVDLETMEKVTTEDCT